MLGLIKKDLFMIKNNLKALLFVIIIYVIFAISGNMEVSFIVPFLTMMISISTFSYDDYNNWHAYITTLPNGKINAIKGKYISCLLLTLGASILGIILTCLIGNIKGVLDIKEILITTSAVCSAMGILLSIIFPLLFKFGSEKGKIVLFIIYFIIFGIGILLQSIQVPKGLITFFNNYGIIILALTCLLALFLSYFISKKVYLKKEF